MGLKSNEQVKEQAGFGKTGIITAAVVVEAILATFFILKSTQKGPIKIGAVLSLSGPASNTGQEARDGMRLGIMLSDYQYAKCRKKCLDLEMEYFFDKSTEFEKVADALKRLTQHSQERAKNEEYKRRFAPPQGGVFRIFKEGPI